ncbi:unnamed protein product, partial [Sphagnum balticum]
TPPRCPRGKIRLQIRTSTATLESSASSSSSSCSSPITKTPIIATSQPSLMSARSQEQKFVLASSCSSPSTPTQLHSSLNVSQSSNKEARKQKIRKEEGFNIPRSMFDVRPSNILLKVRRELVLQKLKISMLGWAEGAAIHKTLNAIGANSMPSYAQVHKPPQLYVAGVPYESLPSWGIHEDWAILHVLQYHQDLPLNLLILSPAHTPNWDLVSDIVNTVSSNYRSPKLCKYHYEVSIVPREEGKVSYEAAPKQKQKKKKDLTATPIAATQTPTSSAATSTTSSTAPNAPAIRVLKTSQLFMQDNNLTFSILNNKRFETIKMIANKRTPTSKNMFINPTGKNPKHIALLSENSINYDQPLQPMQVAFNRAERIAREKQKNLEQQQLAQARQQLVKQQQIKAILQQNPANINVPA